MACSRADVTKVPLPPGIRAGTIVGRGGHNVKWLHFHSGGAHITVNDTGIVIRAKDSQVRARAFVLVQRQLEAALRYAVKAESLPSRVDYLLLASAFGADPKVSFSPRTDEVASLMGQKEKLFQLVPQPPCHRSHLPQGAENPEVEGSSVAGAALDLSPPARCARSRSGSPGKRDQHSERDQDPDTEQDRKSDCGDSSVRWLVAATTVTRGPSEPLVSSHGSCGAGRDDVVDATRSDSLTGAARSQLHLAGGALVEAAQAAAAREPGFELLKARFKLGKTLFRNVGQRPCRAAMSLPELEEVSCSGRSAPQPTFSGYIPPSAVPRVASWLTERLGFSLVERKTSASFHMINQELNLHFTVALAMERHGDDSSAVLRKVQAGGPRCHLVSLLGGPEQLDMRIKLMARDREHPALASDTDVQSTARRIAAAVRSQGFDSFARSKRGMPRNRHLDYAIHKTKSVYEGMLQASGPNGCGGLHRAAISITRVQSDRGVHHEVSGCLPDLDALLAELLLRTQAVNPAAGGPALQPGRDASVQAVDSSGRPGLNASGPCSGALAQQARGESAGLCGSYPEVTEVATSALSALSSFLVSLNEQLSNGAA